MPRPEDAPAIEAVLKTLADARLITTEKDTAEVAHEALIREWPTLRKWLDEDREGLRIHRQLTEDAQEWVALDRDPGALYRGARLAAASEWTKDHADEMNVLEREFLDASRALQVSELEAAKKRAAQLRRRAIYLGGALVAALVAAIVAILFGVRAERQARLALAGQLAAQSQSVLDRFPQRSLLLALEALNATSQASEPRVPAAEDALRQALSNTGGIPLTAHEGRVVAVAFSPDGRWLATGSSDRTARLWHVRLEELVDLACRTAGRHLSRVGWTQYFSGQDYRKTCEQWPEGE